MMKIARFSSGIRLPSMLDTPELGPESGVDSLGADPRIWPDGRIAPERKTNFPK